MDQSEASSIAEGSNRPAGAARLEREEAAAIARYQTLSDRLASLAKIGVWECELKTEALIWTDGVYDLFEIPRGAALKRSKIVDLYDDESRRAMEELRAQTIREGGRFSLDIRVQTLRGHERWIRLIGDAEQENGVTARIFGTKQDITEERRALERLERLQAELIHLSRTSAMGAMAATLAHDLNQPLAAISCYAAGTRRALRTHAPPASVLESSLEGIERSALHAGGIIRRLRTIAAENLPCTRPIDPNALIREASLLALARAPGVSIRYSLANDIWIAIDPLQLQQVMISLIHNAIEAVGGSARPEILVASVKNGETAIFCVEDNGEGVGAELLDSVFESFVSSKPGRSGLGLSIAQTIVEANGGRIGLQNREAGGASFSVSLPLVRAR